MHRFLESSVSIASSFLFLSAYLVSSTIYYVVIIILMMMIIIIIIIIIIMILPILYSLLRVRGLPSNY